MEGVKETTTACICVDTLEKLYQTEHSAYTEKIKNVKLLKGLSSHSQEG